MVCAGREAALRVRAAPVQPGFDAVLAIYGGNGSSPGRTPPSGWRETVVAVSMERRGSPDLH